MLTEEIEQLWSVQRHRGESDYEFVVVDRKSLPVLCVGYNRKFQRCLLLELPKGINGNWPDIEKDNLNLRWVADKGYLVIELLNDYYRDLFNDLTLSIYKSVSKLAIPAEYIANFIGMFHKWSGFFIDRQNGRLSDEELRGLIGELLVLSNLISNASFDTVDNILRSWRGPYDQVRDFITDSEDIEVKTSTGNSDIRISSEFQLDPDPGKKLHLAVVTLVSDLTDGFSLRTLVNELRIKIDSLFGNHLILANGLYQKRLSYADLSQYDNHRFNAKKINFYDCHLPGFPSLIKSQISQSIYQVSYQIRLSALDGFIVYDKEL